MGALQWLLDITLIGLLAATLFHAMRLERALGVLKRDRASLEELVNGFNASTRQAEAGVERLRGAVDGAGRQIARQIEGAIALKADLTFLNERAEQVADRLDGLVRAGRPMMADLPRRTRTEQDRATSGRRDPSRASEPDRTGDAALGPARADILEAEPAGAYSRGEPVGAYPRAEPVGAYPRAEPADERPREPPEPRLRSQAERDLMKALRLAR